MNVDIPNYERIALAVARNGKLHPTAHGRLVLNGWNLDWRAWGVTLSRFEKDSCVKNWHYGRQFGSAMLEAVWSMKECAAEMWEKSN